MADYQSPQFQIAWAKMIARAAVDKDFLKALKENPVAVFKEFGVEVDQKIDLNKDVSPTLDEALESIRRQEAQAAAVAGITGSAPFTGQQPVSGGTFGCFGTYGSGGGTFATFGTGGSAGGAQPPAGSSFPLGSAGTSGGTVGTSSGAAFNCLGSLGSFGTVGGCAFTAGTFGCNVQAGTGTIGTAQPSAASSQLYRPYYCYCACSAACPY